MRHSKIKQSKVNIFLILTIITTIIVLILSIAKYTTTLADDDPTTIATPVLNLEANDTIELSISPTDEEKTYIFCVSNYTDVQTSEVTMNYYIEIEYLKNLPLEFELYEYNNEAQIAEESNLLSETVTDEIEIKLNEKTENYYLLKIFWNESDISYKYAGEIDYVKIILHGEQID